LCCRHSYVSTAMRGHCLQSGTVDIRTHPCRGTTAHCSRASNNKAPPGTRGLTGQVTGKAPRPCPAIYLREICEVPQTVFPGCRQGILPERCLPLRSHATAALPLTAADRKMTRKGDRKSPLQGLPGQSGPGSRRGWPGNRTSARTAPCFAKPCPPRRRRGQWLKRPRWTFSPSRA